MKIQTYQDINIPQDIEAEKTVLGTILFNKQAMNNVIEIIPDPIMFSDPSHRLYYIEILKLYTDQNPIVCTSVSQDTKQVLYLLELEKYSTTHTNVKYFARKIECQYKKRQAIQALSNALRDCRNGSELNDTISTAQKELSLIITPADKDISKVSDLLPEAMQKIIDAEKKENQNTFIMSGFPSIDAVIGGYEKGELIILGGYASHGKTTFALQTLYNIARGQGKPVGVLSYEMNKQQLIMRMLCILARVDYAKVKQGLLSYDETRMINEAEQLLNPLPIFIYYNPKLTTGQITSVMERYNREYGIEFWMVDYLQLIPSTIKDRRLQVEEISRTLKLASGVADVPVMALSQLSRPTSRDSYPKRPTLAMLRESGSIEQDADLVHFVYRDEKNDCVLDIAKARMSKTQTIPMVFNDGVWDVKSYREERNEF